MESKEKVLVQGICYDEKSSFLRGPAKAPQLVRERLWSSAYNHYAEDGTRVSPDMINDIGDFSPEQYWDIYDHTVKHLEHGKKLLSIGGDHSVSYPIVKAVAKYHGRFDILHIDAHGDLYDSFEGDKYSHACPFARIMEDKLTGRLVQVGVRTFTPHQREQVEKFNVEVIEMRDVEAAQLPQFERPIYISLDIDAFDPAYAPGVSHQESGGLTPRQVLRLIHNIGVPVIGADIVEYNPDQDIAGITAALTGKMMKEILATMLK